MPRRNTWLASALVRSESNLSANLGPAAGGQAPKACRGSECAREVCLFSAGAKPPRVVPRAPLTSVLGLRACAAPSPTSLLAQTARHLGVLRWFSLLQVRWGSVQRQRVIARCRAPGTLLRGLDVLRGGGGPVDSAESSKPSSKAPAARGRGRGRGGFHTKQDGINVGSAALRDPAAGRGQHTHRGAGRGAGARGAGAHAGGTGLAGAGLLSAAAAPGVSAVRQGGARSAAGSGGPTGGAHVLAQGTHGLAPPAIPGLCALCVCVCVCACVRVCVCVLCARTCGVYFVCVHTHIPCALLPTSTHTPTCAL